MWFRDVSRETAFQGHHIFLVQALSFFLFPSFRLLDEEESASGGGGGGGLDYIPAPDSPSATKQNEDDEDEDDEDPLDAYMAGIEVSYNLELAIYYFYHSFFFLLFSFLGKSQKRQRN